MWRKHILKKKKKKTKKNTPSASQRRAASLRSSQSPLDYRGFNNPSTRKDWYRRRKLRHRERPKSGTLQGSGLKPLSFPSVLCSLLPRSRWPHETRASGFLRSDEEQWSWNCPLWPLEVELNFVLSTGAQYPCGIRRRGRKTARGFTSSIFVLHNDPRETRLTPPFYK